MRMFRPIIIGLTMAGSAAVAVAADPFIWLEDVQGARAMEWVSAENSKTKSALERDPLSNPQEKAFLASISPYDNLYAGTQYSEPLMWTTTKGDRVGSQHAREFAAKLAALGVPCLFYEVIEGGHASSVTPIEHAQKAAQKYTYFISRLGL